MHEMDAARPMDIVSNCSQISKRDYLRLEMPSPMIDINHSDVLNSQTRLV